MFLKVMLSLSTTPCQPRKLPEGELLPARRRKLLLLVVGVAREGAEDGGNSQRILGPAAASQRVRVRAKAGEGAGNQRNV
jgi:hypothetical protein